MQEYREYEVGELFTVGKDTYKCVQSALGIGSISACSSTCDYVKDHDCNKILCYCNERNDGESVVFILYDSEE